MDPAMMFGMISEHDEDEDETFDLSGWMSRSPPSNGLGDAPMVDDNPFTERPRGGGVTANVAASAMASGPEPTFTNRPRANPRNMGYTISSTGKFQTPLNPLYADDQSKLFGVAGPESPKIVAGIKTGALAVLAGSMLYNRGLPGKRIGTLATLAYVHPVIGWNHGYWNQYLASDGFKGILSTGGKALVHLGAIYAGYKFVRGK